MLTFRPRVLVVAGIAASAVAAATIGATTATAAGTAVTGGNSTIKVSAATRSALSDKHVTIAAFGKASYKNHKIRLPISGGTATPPSYKTKYDGGITFTKGTKVVKLAHIVFNTKTNIATADVGKLGRIDVFKLGEPNGGNGGAGKVEFGGYSVTLKGSAAKTFDSTLSTHVFANHTDFGTGTTTVTFKV